TRRVAPARCTGALHAALPISAAIISPMPREPPVTRATLPEMENKSSMRTPRSWRKRVGPGTVGAVRVADPMSADATHDPFPELRSEEHTSELQSRENLVCRLL